MQKIVNFPSPTSIAVRFDIIVHSVIIIPFIILGYSAHTVLAWSTRFSRNYLVTVRAPTDTITRTCTAYGFGDDTRITEFGQLSLLRNAGKRSGKDTPSPVSIMTIIAHGTAIIRRFKYDRGQCNRTEFA